MSRGEFSPAVRLLILQRAGGDGIDDTEAQCERCGRFVPKGSDRSLHHRRRRGMGGDKRDSTNAASNGLLLCGSGTTLCHGWMDEPGNREEAEALGYVVSAYADPLTVPVWHRTLGLPVLLTDDGMYDMAVA